jgi:hypothetical protein
MKPLRKTHEAESNWKTLTICSIFGITAGAFIGVFVAQYCGKRNQLDNVLLEPRV